MKKWHLIPLLILVTLSACRNADTGQVDEAAGEDEVPVTTPAAAPATPAVTRVAEFQSPLAGGIQSFPFGYHVSIDREVTAKKTGQRAREIGLEFLEGTVVDIDRKVAETFAAAGFIRDGGDVQGRAIRSVYKKPGSTDVLVWVRPGAPRGERFKLQMPDAAGTVYMAWDIKP